MPKAKPAAKYFRLTEKDNAIDYLQNAYEATRTLTKNGSAWKWLVLSLHSAIYGFAICMAQGTDYERVSFTTKKGRRMLIGFDEALRRCQDADQISFYTHSKPLVLTREQRDAIAFLKAVRDQIEHYLPKSWSVEQHDVATAAIDAFDVIRFLALESGNARLDTEQRRVVDIATSKGKATLQKTQLYADFLAAKKRAAIQ